MNSENTLMTIADVATYMQLSEKTILKMIKQDEIPCTKIANQWRFSKPLLEDWVLSRMGVIPQNDLSRLIEQEYDAVPLSRLIHGENIIINMEAGTVREALKILADNAFRTNLVADKTFFLEKLLEREKLSSTAIGEGIALPHLREPTEKVVNEARIIIGTSEAGIDFNAPDGKPAHLIFLPISDSEVVHLRIISKLAHLLRSQEHTDQLKSMRESSEFVKFFIQHNQKQYLRR